MREDTAREAMRLASHKLPIPTRFVAREVGASRGICMAKKLKTKTQDIRKLSDGTWPRRWRRRTAASSRCASRRTTRQLTNHRELPAARRRHRPAEDRSSGSGSSPPPWREVADGGARYGGGKTREGTVVSDKMEKTVVVAVASGVRHRLYRKSSGGCGATWPTTRRTTPRGRQVLIVESRPLSRDKRWRAGGGAGARRASRGGRRGDRPGAPGRGQGGGRGSPPRP